MSYKKHKKSLIYSANAQANAYTIIMYIYIPGSDVSNNSC